MNADLLHALADAVHADLKSTDQVSLLTQLRDALKGQVDQPQQPQHQQRASDVLSSLNEKLAASYTNEYSPGWKQRLQELGIADLVGEPLRDRLNEIFRRNQITIATAHEEVEELRKQVDLMQEGLVFLLDGLSYFGIGKLDLEFGEFEVGLMVPRRAVDNKLSGLGRELRELDKLLSPFSELATGGRPPFTIRSISSSDFGFLIESSAATAAAIAIAIERLTAWYKQLLEIRLLRQGLADQGVTEEELEGVDAHADTRMEQGVEEAVDELMEQFGDNVSSERANELRIELERSLTAFAHRIDEGYHVDVRSGGVTDEEEENGGQANEVDSDLKAFSELIETLRPGMQFVKLEGGPILGLLEPENVGAEEE